MTSTWKEKLARAIPPSWAEEIDAFETQIVLRKQGRIEEKLFAETRLRRGTYGQRYDNGQRHDGVVSRTLSYPSGELTKGPMTMWDAPGMQRIKIPYGKLSADQLETIAALAEEYSDGILHVTTRQDIQLHFVHIEDTPDLMRRLAAVGITTREACGNSVRNVTACPLVGVCSDESFDITPYANAMTFFLLGHPDVQGFGRKFKIAFSGCKDHACGLTNFHDGGCIAKTKVEGGKTVRGFEVYVGGGLGSVPYPAKLLDEFCSEEELLPTMQAVSRVFARLGEKDNRSRARIKFLVKKLGIEEFTRLVQEERKNLRPDPRWTAFLDDLHKTDEKPLKGPGKLPEGPYPAGFEAWSRSNLYYQKQKGYVVATVTLPLGDMTADQARALVDAARKYTGDTMRTTVDQNLCFRWLSESDLVNFYEDLAAAGLGEAGAGQITDVVACPGTDTCKLGISSSRGLAGELRRQLRLVDSATAAASESLHVKCSGCFNSCGQHHVADLGFLGVSRQVGSRKVPHFQVVLGGQWTQNGGSYGLAIGAVPSKRVPEVVARLRDRYVKEKNQGESFKDFIGRVGKKQVRAMLEDLMHVPSYDEARDLYSDWGDPREYNIGDMAEGECAGEVVAFAVMGLAAAEREVFEAQLMFDEGKNDAASDRAYKAMLTGAQALVRDLNPNIGEDADEIVSDFRTRLVDTKLFHDPFMGPKFAQMLFRTHEQKGKEQVTKESTQHQLEEAQLFVEAAYACYQRMTQQRTAAAE
ncbi:MAG TPA: nitrite/sulfite reductase [Polyangiaceae bacterium]|nr:nitrite/sulfite reductase [Polyangiaceae bacterium]